MTAKDIKKYIRYIADWRLGQLGFQPIYMIDEHPLPWLAPLLNGVEHANFFDSFDRRKRKVARDDGDIFLAQWLRGGVKLIWFSPNSTNFRIATPDTANPFIFINSGQIFVQNEGRRSATDVQVTSMPGMPPAGYSIVPSIVHSVENGPQGEWILGRRLISAEPQAH
jgi:hypothetical protein